MSQFFTHFKKRRVVAEVHAVNVLAYEQQKGYGVHIVDYLMPKRVALYNRCYETWQIFSMVSTLKQR